MSTPQQRVAARAVALNRRLYASRPWGYRVAQMLIVLAADSLGPFGRTMYAEFIKSAVRGMPATPDGKQALDMVQEVQRHGGDALSAGYGRPFAERTWKILVAKFGDPEIAEEAMSHVMLQAARGKFHVHNGSSLHEAESYAITACLNQSRTILRSKQRRREEPLVRERDTGREVDIADPDTFRDLGAAITPREMERILVDAERVSPRAREYLEAVLRGDSQSDWARELGVSDAAVSKFVRKIRPSLKRVLHDHLRSASAASFPSYDFR